MYANLHTHTFYSDGTDSPRGILDLAREHGLKAVAITDHDCVDGVIEAHGFMDEYDIRLINGIELSTIYEGSYVHVLGHHIDIQSPVLLSYISESRKEMTEGVRLKFEKAKSHGAHSFSWERVVELNPGREYIGDMHVKLAMDADGYEPEAGFREMFMTFFHVKGKEFVQYGVKTPFDAIDVIKAAGGMSALAHPKLIGSDEKMMKFVKHGVDGLEVYHPTNQKQDEEKYLAIASERGLHVTGGSDWHGKNSAPHITHFDMRGLGHGDYKILKF